MEEYTSYDLALDNRDALASDAYKNAENYSVFENAGGSINFYPDKSGAAPTAEMYHRETSEFSVQDVKAFCKKHGITENVFFISAFGITLGKYNFRKDIYHYLPRQKRFQTFRYRGYAGKDSSRLL